MKSLDVPSELVPTSERKKSPVGKTVQTKPAESDMNLDDIVIDDDDNDNDGQGSTVISPLVVQAKSTTIVAADKPGSVRRHNESSSDKKSATAVTGRGILLNYSLDINYRLAANETS